MDVILGGGRDQKMKREVGENVGGDVKGRGRDPHFWGPSKQSKRGEVQAPAEGELQPRGELEEFCSQFDCTPFVDNSPKTVLTDPRHGISPEIQDFCWDFDCTEILMPPDKKGRRAEEGVPVAVGMLSFGTFS